MLKIYYNEKSNADVDIKIRLAGTFLKVEAKDKELEGTGVVETLRSYNSYSLVDKSGLVKVYRTIVKSDYKLLDLNRLGVASKLDFSDLQQLYGAHGLVQIDTGMICPTERDIIIRVFIGKKDKIVVDADMEYEILPFNSDDLPVLTHPRMTLWDSYSISVNGKELKANRKGAVQEGEFDIPILTGDKTYVEFFIQKYKGPFEEPLVRDIDDDEVLVESTCGVLNTRRVYLENGRGSFKLYPLDYSGPFKLKLGRKWYEVWNEYNLLMGDA